MLQDSEDKGLDCARRVLLAQGWAARSWQQDGLLVEEVGRRQLRGGGGGEAAKAQLRAAMDVAEAKVREEMGIEIQLLIKPFFGQPIGHVLQRFAGSGRKPPTAAAGSCPAARPRTCSAAPRAFWPPASSPPAWGSP